MTRKEIDITDDQRPRKGERLFKPGAIYPVMFLAYVGALILAKHYEGLWLVAWLTIPIIVIGLGIELRYRVRHGHWRRDW